MLILAAFLLGASLVGEIGHQAGGAPSAEVENQIDSAQKLMQAREFGKALEVLTALMQRQQAPPPDAFILMATCQLNLDQTAKAIEAFKLVLAQEPNQPEAHAYMGFILAQAGHGDGALMAFEKALAVAPSFPMALWGKGMVLYRDKQDYAGARPVLEKLLQLMPPGEERNEITKVLAEIPASGGPPQKASAVAPTAANSAQTISGKITVDAKLKDKIDNQATLFIIARPAGGAAGPPLAVKKIDKPSCPLSYSLGHENVMMQGTPFAGPINITVRLDKDSNAVTREAGNLLGDYKKNPVTVGSQNVDIILDQLAQ